MYENQERKHINNLGRNTLFPFKMEAFWAQETFSQT